MNTETITSRDNPLFKRLRTLAQETSTYRKLGQVWLEGDHLCRAMRARNLQPELVVHTAAMTAQVAGWGLAPSVRRVVMADALMQQLSTLESAAPVGCLWALPATSTIKNGVATVVLDRLQDPGNVGSILRTAAAMGFQQVVTLKGTAALWSSKVLRAGMGAHFALHLVEGAQLDELDALEVPTLATSSHEGDWLHQARLPWPCAWLLGHEGQGVSQTLLEAATQKIRIAQPGGEESLNVAAAAAICLHASGTQRLM